MTLYNHELLRVPCASCQGITTRPVLAWLSGKPVSCDGCGDIVLVDRVVLDGDRDFAGLESLRASFGPTRD